MYSDMRFKVVGARSRIEVGDSEGILSFLSSNDGDWSLICNFGWGVVSRSRHIGFLIGTGYGLVEEIPYFQFGQGMSMFESSGKVGALNLLINGSEAGRSVTRKKSVQVSWVSEVCLLLSQRKISKHSWDPVFFLSLELYSLVMVLN